MKNTPSKYASIGYALVVGMVISHVQLVLAGWTGAMNGIGFGMSSVNVSEPQGGSRTVTTTNMQDPSVAMTNTPTYVFGGPLPKRASPATVAKVKGSAGYVWQATTVGSNGDSTDSSEFAGVQINPADCASLEMVSSSVIAPDDKSGTITVNAAATAGTALRVRGYEALGNLPVDDPDTTVNETLEFLKAHGALKWDITLLGPFDLNTTNCNALVIPFTIETGTTNLYFVTDGVAKSLPLIINCPNDVVVKCEDSFSYPPVTYAGCGNITVSFNPPPLTNAAGNIVPFPPGSGSFPVGTNLVTVTATDKDGNTTNCTFNVVVTDTTPPVIMAIGTPANGVLGYNPTAQDIDDALGTATITDNCGAGTTNVQTSNVSANGCSRSQTRTWTAADAGGNQATPVSRTVTWTEDTTKPVITATGTASNGVLGYNPSAAQIEAALGTATANDNCGNVTPTPQTSSVTSDGCSRSQTRTWTAVDAGGNQATPVSRTVTWTEDTTKPVITATGTPANGVLGVNPTAAQINAALGTATASDNCGSVTPTATTSSITTNGCSYSQTRTWNVTDAAGNVATPVSRTVTWSPGFTFTGFYSPISGTDGTCAEPLITKTPSSTLPIKFDMKCDTTPITGGTPPVVHIQQYGTNCVAGSEIVVTNAVYQNDWHYNWNVSNRSGGTYKVTVVLPDGTSRYVFVKLK